ncbi:transcriptional regulator ovo-like [Anopheles cruzii]|uniref:transcriptional regulator ovo-like n=1 Tax=Anopheles cruzii TaxID=68878 RepID=UPI0022EC4E68|nr:transcriptional regulator ovo-like [Anopheles cruzii]
MLGFGKKPGPPVPPRPSAATVATALARHRENSPSPTAGFTVRGSNVSLASGLGTLKPPHPGRTVVYKSPDLEQPNRTTVLQASPRAASRREISIYHELLGGAAELRPAGGSPQQSPTPLERGKPLSPGNGGVMYRSTCSIVEINSPASSVSSSASSSPVATLQKPPLQDLQSFAGGRGSVRGLEPPVVPVARRRMRGAEGGDLASEVIIINTGGNSIPNGGTGRKDFAIGGGGGRGVECDSGTERGDSSGSSASAGSTLERENNLRNLESAKSSSHFTEIIIGSNQTSTVVRSGSKPNIAARTEGTGAPKSTVIRSSSIRLPLSSYHRPEPEGGEHVQPSPDDKQLASGVASAPSKPPLATTNLSKSKSSTRAALDPATLDSKLSEQKFAFHELLISELTAMREKQQQQRQAVPPDEPPPPVPRQPESELELLDLEKVNRRQRCPSERRSSCSEASETSPSGTAVRLPKIRTSDWIEVGDNGKQVLLSSCQISLEDSGMEDEEKLDDASSGVGDSWDSVKEDVESRIIMSLPGLPPLPKSLSGFDLAGTQLQPHHHHSHHHHHHQQQQQQQSQHSHYGHHLHQQQHSTPIHQSHHQQQQQSFHGTGGLSSHPPSNHLPSSQSPVTLNHHHTNPFIPIGGSAGGLLHGGGSIDPQRGHSPVGSSLSSSGSGRKTSPQPAAASVPTTTLDTQLAILRREMYGLRQLDLSLLSQLWALNESIQEFRTILQEQETLSPPSPTPSNSDANSVSSDDDVDEDESSATTNSTNNVNQQQQQQQQLHQQQLRLLSAHHPLQSSTTSIVSSVGSGAGGGGNGLTQNESGGSNSTTLSSSASSRMRAPPPPPPNRKAPSRPV